MARGLAGGMPILDAEPRLIALDWGTTHARGYLLAAGGLGPVVLDETQGDGISRVRAGKADRVAVFDAILTSMVGAWLRSWPGLPMIACGMVGAAQGWRTAAYRSLPTDLTRGGGLTVVESSLGPLSIIAGVKKSVPNADVMRGEETQLAGLTAGLTAHRTATIVLPGTHTKWAVVRDGVLLDFDTAMSGELYELLAEQSMVGRVAEPATAGLDWRSGFDWGLELALRAPGALAFQAFVIRSSVLDGQLAGEAVRDAVSGLLVGQEIATRIAAGNVTAGQVVLCGAAGLVARYQRALARIGVDSMPAGQDATIRGLWQSALGAGLLEEEK